LAKLNLLTVHHRRNVPKDIPFHELIKQAKDKDLTLKINSIQQWYKFNSSIELDPENSKLSAHYVLSYHSALSRHSKLTCHSEISDL